MSSTAFPNFDQKDEGKLANSDWEVDAWEIEWKLSEDSSLEAKWRNCFKKQKTTNYAKFL